MAGIRVEKNKEGKPNGCRSIVVVCPDGVRRPIRLGKVTHKQAEKVKGYIEELNAAKKAGLKPDEAAAKWVQNTTADVRSRVIRVGLWKEAERDVPSITIKQLCDRFIESRKSVKESTRQTFYQARDCLLRYFDGSKMIDTINEGDAEAWREWLLTEGNIREGKQKKKSGAPRGKTEMSENTVRRRTGLVRQFFNWAMKNQLVKQNPFMCLPCAVGSNEDRQFFVTHDVINEIIAAAPDAEWRAIIALSRFGGIRTPSETLELTWGDIDFANRSMRVFAPKTAHHKNKGVRYCPIFPELLPYIEDLWELAKETATESTPLITRYRDSNTNLRTQMLRILHKVNVKPWPKLFQNLRASRETELLDTYPIKDVCSWIGNSQAVAMANYAMKRDSSFARAAGLDEATRNPDHSGGQDTQKATQQDEAGRGQNVPELPDSQGETLVSVGGSEFSNRPGRT